MLSPILYPISLSDDYEYDIIHKIPTVSGNLGAWMITTHSHISHQSVINLQSYGATIHLYHLSWILI